MAVKKMSKPGGASSSATKKRSASSSSSISRGREATTEALVETTFTDGTPKDSRKQEQLPSTTTKKTTKRVKFDDAGLSPAVSIPSEERKGNKAATAVLARRGRVAATAPTPAKVGKGATKPKRSRTDDDDAYSSSRGAEKGLKGKTQRAKAAKTEEEPNTDEDEVHSLVDSSSGDEDLQNDEEENLSELASISSSDAGLEDENPFVKARRTGERLAYSVLLLRFLPPEFQEPQLYKFLGQFGAEVLNCFCVRSRRTHQSKGIAYVQFDRESVLPTVVEECHGMLLGGRTVQAKVVMLHRAMPPKESVAKRRQLAYAYKTKGAPLKRHNVSQKDPVALLIKAARTEKQNNDYLKSLGIDYATDFFTSQLGNVPSHLIDNKKKPRGLKLGKAPETTAEATAATLELEETKLLGSHDSSPAKDKAAKENGEKPTGKASAKESNVELKDSEEKNKKLKKSSKAVKRTKPLKK